jgi:chromosome segregation ATPase
MNEQEKCEKVGTFRDAAEGLIKMFETQADGLRQMSEFLDSRKVALDERAKDLDEREVKLVRREAEVCNVRQLAADRKVQMEGAKDAADRADKARRNAEAEVRLVKKEKEQLEAVLAKLLQEKNELATALAAVPQLQFIKDNAAPVEAPVEKS